MRKVLGCAVVLCALVALPLKAQYRWGIAAGVQLPNGDYGKVDKMGYTAGIGASMPLSTWPVRGRIEANYATSSHKDIGGTSIGGKTNIIGGMASIVYPFSASGSVKPYILGGLGYYQVKVDVTGFGSVSESKIGFGGGGGILFNAGSAHLMAEARFISVSTSGSSTTFIPITIGMLFGPGAK